MAIVLALAPAVFAAESRSRAPSLEGVVNVNTATAEQLRLLPGVGKSRAKAIVEQRKATGGFKRVEDLQQVKGIGPAMLKKMRPHVSLSGKTTARRVAPSRKTKSQAPRGGGS